MNRILFLTLVWFSSLAFATSAHAQVGSDSFAGAQALVGTNVRSTATSITGFTTEAGEPAILGHRQQSAWWSFTPAADGVCVVETLGGFGNTFEVADTVLGVFTGSAVNALTQVAADDDFGSEHSRVIFQATANTTYFIDVMPYNPSTAGDVEIRVRQLQAGAGSWKGVWSLDNTPGKQGTLEFVTAAYGMVTGRVRMGTAVQPFSTYLTVDGHFTISVPLPGADAEDPTPALTFVVDAAPFTPGTVNFTVDSGDSHLNLFSAYRAISYPAATPAPRRGYYTARFIDGAGANGYLTVTVTPRGGVIAKGRALDGTPLLLTGHLSGDPAAAAQRVSLYQAARGGTFCLVNLNISATEVTTDEIAAMGRPAHIGATFYPAGYYVNPDLKGAPYTAPAAGSRAGGLLDASAGAGHLTVATAGTEITTFTEALTLSTANKFAFTSATRRPVLTINPATGVISGTLFEPAGVRRVLYGILVESSPVQVTGIVSGATAYSTFTISP